jgi:hypothetical protein
MLVTVCDHHTAVHSMMVTVWAVSNLPAKAAGQMDLLTVPSGDGADMRFRQDVH